MSRAYIFWINVLGLLATFSVYKYYLPLSDQTELNLISLFGTYLSIFGIVIAYFQILSVKQIAEQAKQVSLEALNATKKLISISELSKYKKLIEEVQRYLIQSNFDAATIRMADLKENLIQNKYVPQLSKQTASKRYKDIVANVGIHITTLHQKLADVSTVIDIKIIIDDLETAKSTVIEFENALKSEE